MSQRIHSSSDEVSMEDGGEGGVQLLSTANESTAPTKRVYVATDPRMVTLTQCLLLLTLSVVVVLCIILATKKHPALPDQSNPSGNGGGSGGNTGHCATTDLPTLECSITVDAMSSTLETLNDIADMNGGTRVVGPGYDASLAFIQSQLSQFTDYTLEVFPFAFTQYNKLSTPVFQKLGGEAVTFQEKIDYRVFSYSGTGNVTAEVFAVPDYGCVSGDYTTFVPGRIAVISRGGCNFVDKVYYAQEAGAAGVVMYNEGDTTERLSLFSGSLSAFDEEFGGWPQIPAFSTAFDLGQTLQASGTILHMDVLTSFEDTQTYDLIADARTGTDATTVVVGTHLDSVAAGPGINDNGSGSALNLALALEYSRTGLQGRAHNRVKFCWWGAEEEGLLGSYAWVDHLVNDEPAEWNKVALNLNFDMVGSPNFIRGVYNGGGEASPADVREGSGVLQDMFSNYLDDMNIAYQPVDFNGRSDYGPFIENGVPAGGLDTGAEVIKTEEERKIYGGFANAQFDPCYHQHCDTWYNIDWDVYGQLGMAAGHVVESLALNTNLAAAVPKSTQAAQTRVAAKPARRNADGLVIARPYVQSDGTVYYRGEKRYVA